MTKIFQSEAWAKLNEHLNPVWIGNNLFFRTGGILYTKGDVTEDFKTKEKFLIQICKTKLPYFSRPNIDYVADLTKPIDFPKWTRKMIRKAINSNITTKDESIEEIRKFCSVLGVENNPDSYWNNLKELSHNLVAVKDNKIIAVIVYMVQDDEAYGILQHNLKEEGTATYLLIDNLFNILKQQGIKSVSFGDAANKGIAEFKKKFFEEVPCWDYTNDALRKLKWQLKKWGGEYEKFNKDSLVAAK